MSTGPAFHKQLTRDVVVREALALLDEQGLDALTMRALADRLGVVPNALYRHVADKDDLLDGVMDAAVASVPLPAAHRSWQEDLAEIARAIRTTMLAHPAVASLVVSRPSLGPSGVAIGERALGALLDAGFAPRDAERTLNLVLVWTLGFVALEVPRLDAAGLDGAYEHLDPAELPHTARVRPDPMALVSEAQFSFGLERLLDSVRDLAA